MITMKNIITILTLIFLISCNNQVDKKDKISNENQINEKNETSIDKNTVRFDSIVAIKFINGYVELNNKTLAIKDRLIWVDSSKLVTDGFKKSFKKIMDNDEIIEADPIFNAQDYPDKGFELVDFNNKTGQVILIGKDWPDFKISLRLIILDGKTLVDGCGKINKHNDR
jgi:hypothetical protein